MTNFETAYLAKHPANRYVLTRMNEYAGAPDWGDFNKAYLSGLKRHFRNAMCASSARTALATISAVMNEHSDVIDLPNDFSKTLRVKTVNNVETWLNEEELYKLERFLKVGTKNERTVIADFLIGAWTGARHSDFENLETANIIGERLTYVSKKSGIKASIPVKPIVEQLLSKERCDLSNSSYTRIIKNICMKAGISQQIKLYRRGKETMDAKWVFISPHTARRSFATNLFLRGVDILTISRYMGHSSIEMTKKYIVCENIELSEQEIEFFK